MQVIGMVLVTLGLALSGVLGLALVPMLPPGPGGGDLAAQGVNRFASWRCTRPVAGYHTLRGDRRWLPTHRGHRERGSSCPWEEARAGIHR
jgi:hypothetical protein